FTGADLVGDANQLSYALTSRWLDAGDGSERARLGLGQVLYFRDRKVTLPGEAAATASSSPLVGEAFAALGGGVGVSGALHWDPHDSETDLGALALDYRPASDRLARLGYRYNRATLEQADLALSWPVSERWQFVGRWNYSLRASTSLETFAGIEYKSCCWSARVVVREYARDSVTPDDKDLAVLFQLELKGLSRVGQDIGNFLAASIPGYREPE
ncbi:MAG TPA: LPS assembly protein LptD, partial [Gammaproteobacteria bacterium]